MIHGRQESRPPLSSSGWRERRRGRRQIPRESVVLRQGPEQAGGTATAEENAATAWGLTDTLRDAISPVDPRRDDLARQVGRGRDSGSPDCRDAA